MSPVERAARVFTPKVRGIEINRREGTERKRESVCAGAGAEWVGGAGGCLSGGDGNGGGVGREKSGGLGRASCKLAGLAD